MEPKSNPIYQSAMTSGLILGIAQVTLILIVHLMGFDIIRPPFLATLLNYIIIIGVIIYSTIKFRDESLDGEISYSKALGFGLLVSVFAGLVYGIYMIIHMRFIDTNYLTNFISAAEEVYYMSGFSEKQIEDALRLLEMIQKPIVMVIYAVFGSTFLGLIFSLVTSIFLKKKKSIL